MRLFFFLIMMSMLLSSCNSLKTESISSATPAQPLLSASAEVSEESMIVTEQAMARTVQAEVALTIAAQPTFTDQPTFTPILAHLATLTPIANSTPAQVGAFFDVPSNVLGPGYQIENACYFDTQAGRERYEIYAGSIAGSGDAYSAQGTVVIRIFRIVEKDGTSYVELADTKEQLTLEKRGPLRLSSFGNCSDSWMMLTTPLNFGWFLNPVSQEFYQYEGIVPRARLDVAEQSQLAEIGSYCWKGTCADGPVIPTPSLPLVIRSSQFIHLYLPLDQPPDGLTLSAMVVSPPGLLQGDPAYDYIGEDSASWSYEKPGREPLDLGTFSLRREQDIKFSLKPGYYAITVLAVWHDYGDVRYGFLVEVQE
jgi:hypothetical protein